MALRGQNGGISTDSTPRDSSSSKKGPNAFWRVATSIKRSRLKDLRPRDQLRRFSFERTPKQTEPRDDQCTLLTTNGDAEPLLHRAITIAAPPKSPANTSPKARKRAASVSVIPDPVLSQPSSPLRQTRTGSIANVTPVDKSADIGPSTMPAFKARLCLFCKMPVILPAGTCHWEVQARRMTRHPLYTTGRFHRACIGTAAQSINGELGDEIKAAIGCREELRRNWNTINKQLRARDSPEILDRLATVGSILNLLEKLDEEVMESLAIMRKYFDTLSLDVVGKSNEPGEGRNLGYFDHFGVRQYQLYSDLAAAQGLSQIMGVIESGSPFDHEPSLLLVSGEGGLSDGPLSQFRKFLARSILPRPFASKDSDDSPLPYYLSRELTDQFMPTSDNVEIIAPLLEHLVADAVFDVRESLRVTPMNNRWASMIDHAELVEAVASLRSLKYQSEPQREKVRQLCHIEAKQVVAALLMTIDLPSSGNTESPKGTQSRSQALHNTSGTCPVWWHLVLARLRSPTSKKVHELCEEYGVTRQQVRRILRALLSYRYGRGFVTGDEDRPVRGRPVTTNLPWKEALDYSGRIVGLQEVADGLRARLRENRRNLSDKMRRQSGSSAAAAKLRDLGRRMSFNQFQSQSAASAANNIARPLSSDGSPQRATGNGSGGGGNGSNGSTTVTDNFVALLRRWAAGKEKLYEPLQSEAPMLHFEEFVRCQRRPSSLWSSGTTEVLVDRALVEEDDLRAQMRDERLLANQIKVRDPARRSSIYGAAL